MKNHQPVGSMDVISFPMATTEALIIAVQKTHEFLHDKQSKKRNEFDPLRPRQGLL